MSKRETEMIDGWRSPSTLSGLPSNASVLLALSGGADSRALLDMLAKCADVDGFSLTLAHVNHSIRGETALRDRAFCQRLADAYGLEIVFLDADVPALAKEHGRGLEEEAREVRYAFFARLMEERSIPLLATAHHADDLLETVLFRLSRGTGPAGLCGIAPSRRFANGFLTRPLLRVTREEILDYCRVNKLEFVVDETNTDTAYARNRIRSEVVPILESLFPTPQKRVLSLTEDLREDEALLTELCEECLDRARTPMGLSVEVLCQAPTPICRRVLMRWVEAQTGSAPERVHLAALMRLIVGETPRARVALPNGVSAVAEMGYLRALSSCETVGEICMPFCDGVTDFPTLGVSICVQKGDGNDALTKINNLSTVLHINLNKNSAIIKKECFWRTYREGDVILQHGMHKKLRRLYREAGVPPRLRNRIPLLCDAEGILWAPFSNALRDGASDDGEPYTVCVSLDGVEKDGAFETENRPN